MNNDWLASRTLPNGVSTNYSYNAVGMLTGLTNSNGSGTLSSFTNFSYDGVFNLKGFSANVPGSSNNGTSSYSYDSNFRLTGETTPSASNSFAYDAAGNPTTFKGLTQAFNANNQLTSNTYDLNGNPTTYKGTSLTFDPENRMTGYGSAFAAGYRCDNLRAWKQNASGQRTYFYYVGGTPVLETDASGNVTATNVFDDAGLVARQSGGAWTYYAFDQQGNVTQRLDGSGNVLGTLAFDAYGAGATADPFGYNGQWGYYSDFETGLYYCQNRYYDASAGRWLTRDPIGFEGGINIYSYASSSPSQAIDDDGLDWIAYTGQRLTWYYGKYGDRRHKKFSIAGTSGGYGLQNPDCAKVKGSNTDGNEGGPVPPGRFHINLVPDPNRMTTFGSNGFSESNVGIQRLPTHSDGSPVVEAWGTWRARLERDKGNSYGRDNHYLHDSGKGQTHGCVECRRFEGRKLLKSLLDYRAAGHSRILVWVGYTDGDLTNGGTGLP